ncbi:MAG TPA: hypothetical protein VMG55_16385 [Stellaceae bacterium]|nr:hypothetical protein [Stellaceae bacterium]
MSSHSPAVPVATPRGSWVVEALVLAVAAGAAISAGVYFRSLWVGIAVGVAAFPGIGCIRSALARRFGWRPHSLVRMAALAWQVLTVISAVLDFVGIFV